MRVKIRGEALLGCGASRGWEIRGFRGDFRSSSSRGALKYQLGVWARVCAHYDWLGLGLGLGGLGLGDGVQGDACTDGTVSIFARCFITHSYLEVSRFLRVSDLDTQIGRVLS